MSISAMKQVYAVPLIEQLESVPADARMMYEHDKFHHQNIPVGRLCHEAAAALRQAIADAERQEPVFYVIQATDRFGEGYEQTYWEDPNGFPVYTAPVHANDINQERVDETAKRKHEWVGQPDLARVGEVGVWGHKREWVGLTDEEVGGLTVFDGLHDVEVPILADFVRAIEAKLKEKNT